MEIKFKNELKGERLLLRVNKASIELAKEIFETVDNNREYLAMWLPWVKYTQTVEDSLKYLFEIDEETKKGNKVNYGIFLDKKYIGQIGVFDIDKENKSCEIGYWLSAKYGRKGFMSEALSLLEKELFVNQGMNRIQIKCDERNKASASVAVKGKYKLDGLLREDSFVEKENKFRNSQVYSKLKSEFK